jgi:hypothetical protein
MYKVNPTISNLIKEHTNKWLEKYSNKQPIISSFNEYISQLTLDNPNKNKNYLHIMYFVSLFSFIIGFNCRRLLEQPER